MHKVGLTESTKHVALSFYDVDIHGSLLALSADGALRLTLSIDSVFINECESKILAHSFSNCDN